MTDQKTFALRGAAAFSKSRDELVTFDKAYIVCEKGLCAGVFKKLPERYKGIRVEDCEGMLITPGLVDLHTHAPQYSFRGTGMDRELIEWLQETTFPEEANYADALYAERSYDLFVEDLYEGATTRACVFATIDVPSTVRLMEMMEEAGLVSYVGKVSMDRNAPDYYCEKTEDSLRKNEEWLAQTQGRFANTSPMLTPRFTPACTDQLLEGLGQLQRKYHVPVQSHLSENPKEISLVKKLSPKDAFYGQTYARHGLFGNGVPTVMAHCIYPEEAEIALMKENGVYAAHCPESNMNLASGIAPVRRYLEEGIAVGLGTDVAAGTSASVFRAMAQAVQVSKLRWRLCDSSLKPLLAKEVFYMGTKGGGSFFGRAGSFEKGYEFDAVVFDDSNLATLYPLSTEERLERLIYCSDDRNVVSKYIRGNKIY